MLFGLWAIRSDQIGLSLPSPHASTCGMGIVHTLLTRRVTDSPARVVSFACPRASRLPLVSLHMCIYSKNRVQNCDVTLNELSTITLGRNSSCGRAPFPRDGSTGRDQCCSHRFEHEKIFPSPVTHRSIATRSSGSRGGQFGDGVSTAPTSNDR